MTIGEPCKTIIVDDETLIRQGIKHYFNWEEEGFLVVGEASNGQEALELIEEVRPHIIITDIVMPIMDGEELTRIVKEKYPEIEILILSSFGEFDYVRSSFQRGVVDYILKPKLEAKSLLEALQTAASRIESLHYTGKKLNSTNSIDHIIEKLISGFEVELKAVTINQAFPNIHFQLIALDRMIDARGNFDSLKEKVSMELEKNFQSVKYHFFTTNQNLCCLINVNKLELEKILPFFTKVSNNESGVVVLMSEVFSELSQLGEIYKSSLSKLMECRFYFPERTILMHELFSKASKNNENFHLDWFTEELKQQRFNTAFTYVQEHGQALTQCYTTDVFEYKSFFNNVIFNISNLLRDMDFKVDTLEEWKYTYIRNIDAATCATEVLDQLHEFIKKAQECIFSKGTALGNPNMKRILDYISEHFREQLTLRDVANHFYFSPSYLSSYFTTHTKETFTEYLNKIRVEEAKKLLRTTTSISEISLQVGYSDHSYFCKVFKKLTNQAPSQYRRKVKLN